MGQDTESPQNARTVQQNTRCGNKRQNRQAEVLGELERICNASLVRRATSILQITTLLRSKCGVWSVLQTGRATRCGTVGLPTGSLPPFSQRPASLCPNLVNPYRPREETRNATTEKILCTHTWLSDAPRYAVSRTSRRRNGLECDRCTNDRKRRSHPWQRSGLPRQRDCPGCRVRRRRGDYRAVSTLRRTGPRSLRLSGGGRRQGRARCARQPLPLSNHVSRHDLSRLSDCARSSGDRRGRRCGRGGRGRYH